MNSRIFRRKRILIDEFQFRLLGMSFIYLLVIFFIMGAVIFIPLILQLNDESLPLEVQQRVADQFLTLHVHLGPPLLFVLLLLALHSIIITHRIAGPLMRFKKVFQLVEKGDLSVQFNLRKSDYLKNHAAAINRMVQSLEDNIRTIQNLLRSAHQSLDQIKPDLYKIASFKMHSEVGRLEAQMNEARDHLGLFKLSEAKENLDPISIPPKRSTPSDGLEGKGGREKWDKAV